ncbi:MAG: PDZ domain-containing protein [Firmicutes bacterium]|nr:PDZ domain-containing protein [Bacillota bacterium]
MIKKENYLAKILVVIFVFFLGCGAMYSVIAAFPSVFSTNITKLEKNVTVTDTGLAESVEKVYDAVVVVSTYKDNRLYSTGTGFVFKTKDKKAYIMTNNHVIESGSKVTVTFTSGNVIETEVVGSDTLSDIAVLSVDEKEIISVAEVGKSEDLRVGDTSFAVGAPLDSVYSWTVTRGIISGKDRMVEVELSSASGDYVMKVLQTDAAINSGNSGGPLCNANGEVIGVASLKLVDESVEGMGFAIPIELALEYAEKIMAGEIITQPYLGVGMINVTDAYYYPQYYKMLNQYDITSGVIVYQVEEDSPADKAGFKIGDVIVKVNDDDVSSIGYLRYYLYNYRVGDKITITYIRNGDTKTTTVTLGSSEKVY